MLSFQTMVFGDRTHPSTEPPESTSPTPSPSPPMDITGSEYVPEEQSSSSVTSPPDSEALSVSEAPSNTSSPNPDMTSTPGAVQSEHSLHSEPEPGQGTAPEYVYDPSTSSSSSPNPDHSTVAGHRVSTPGPVQSDSASTQPPSEPEPGPSAAPATRPGVGRGLSGTNWYRREDDYLPCSCGSLIHRKRVPRHVNELCRLKLKSPLQPIRPHLKQVVGWSRIDADKRVKCSDCSATITATQRTSIAKAVNTHLCKKHRQLSSRARYKIPREIFRRNHVLVATNVSTAVATGLPLDSGSHQEVAEYRNRHGTSKAQATAPTREESREAFVLRISFALHPDPHPLFLINGLFSKDAKPSKSTLNFLCAIERDVGFPIVDWRSIIGITQNRIKVKEYLQEMYHASAQSGYMKAQSLRKFSIFVRNHLGEMENGEEWTTTVDMFRLLVETTIKENCTRVQKAMGEREVRHMTSHRLPDSRKGGAHHHETPEEQGQGEPAGR